MFYKAKCKNISNPISVLIVSFALILFLDRNRNHQCLNQPMQFVKTNWYGFYANFHILELSVFIIEKVKRYVTFYCLSLLNSQKIHQANGFIYFLSVYIHDIGRKKNPRMHIPLTGIMFNLRKTPHNQLCRQAHETLLYGTRVFVPEKNSWSWMEG